MEIKGDKLLQMLVAGLDIVEGEEHADEKKGIPRLPWRRSAKA